MNKEGVGKYGWEELPYWLKGYANIGYMLDDKAMIKEAKFWIELVLKNQRDNGDFGPMVMPKENVIYGQTCLCSGAFSLTMNIATMRGY